MLLGALAAAQSQQALGDYLDIYIAQVKPEKRAEFDAINAKMAAANRQNKGDVWLAMETVYGPGNRVTFVSTRNSYGDVEIAMGAFEQAITKGSGKAAADKLTQEFNQCLVSSRTEIRRRRWDLSSNAPTDPDAYAKLIANSRWLRMVTIHVRPGQTSAFEDLLKDLKAARDKVSPPISVFVSTAVAGQEGTVYYVTTLEPSLAAFDSIPSVQKMLGEDGYAKFLKVNAEAVSDTETAINHFLPELSNPPEQIVAAAPDFWKPKAVTAKVTGAKPPAVNAAETSKMNDKK
jgi:quinol monooxygenase YgiN